MQYDVFISHAWEDKEVFVRPLVEELIRNNIAVWYDDFSLKPGDSLRRSIDFGLVHSRHGIVVLSPSFFEKEWTQWELDGLISRQNSEKTQIVIPIWHNIDKEHILKISPSLADKVAIINRGELKEIANRLVHFLKPQGSSLVIARDICLEYGLSVPPITDDWWLDKIQYCGSNDMEGTFQDAMGWGIWGFPLPPAGDSPKERGLRIAWATLQTEWQRSAKEQRLSQLSHPNLIHEFISSHPGLSETCHRNLHFLLAYAPQISIQGFGGQFEAQFDEWLERSKHAYSLRNGNQGSGLTTTGKPPQCDELLALRCDNFGDYESKFIACNFVQGDLMGPPVNRFEIIDYALWLLSKASDWLPRKHHSFLLDGMKKWGGWSSWNTPAFFEEYDIEYPNMNGYFIDQVMSLKTGKKIKLTQNALSELIQRVNISKLLLDFPETTAELVEKFLSHGFIEEFILKRSKRSEKKI